MVLPVFAVPGIGAVVSPVPPAWEVYHRRLSPVAVNAPASSPWQYSTDELFTDGASGRALTITVAVVVVNGVLQSPRVMFVKVKVVFELTSLTVTSTDPASSRGTILGDVDVPSS